MSPESDIDFPGFYKKYRTAVFLYLKKITGNGELAQDLMQDVFLAAFRYLETYSPEKGTPLTWLNTIARNLYYRQQKGKKDDTLDLPENMESKYKNATAEMEEDATNREVHAAVATLPEPERSIVKYKYFEHKSLKECAEIMKISESTISRRLFDGVKQLRMELQKRDITL